MNYELYELHEVHDPAPGCLDLDLDLDLVKLLCTGPLDLPRNGLVR